MFTTKSTVQAAAGRCPSRRTGSRRRRPWIAAGALAGEVEILDVEAQDLVGASSGLVEQPPQRAFAQVDVAALPQPLEARERDAAGVVVFLGTALQIDAAVDRQDLRARAVARERSDRRDVAVLRRRRRA
jgi:hypothetical protein